MASLPNEKLLPVSTLKEVSYKNRLRSAAIGGLASIPLAFVVAEILDNIGSKKLKHGTGPGLKYINLIMPVIIYTPVIGFIIGHIIGLDFVYKFNE